MNKELALRTFAYLIGHYKTHNATIINSQEIEAIEFILNDNEFLEQQLHDASIQIQELIEKDIWCPSNCEKLEKLQQETEKLKKQYCERTDCGGRIGNSKKVEELQNENKQMKDNWNKLKEWLKEYEEGTYGLGSYETGLSDGLGDVIKKMQELEGSDSDE
ncbi:hypothetical protein [Megamonas funiformis]|uniref:hypothetical protein n=1 Tax=Megamonas funiformis TaxID=437897 RepID=UPI003F7F9216